MQYIAKLLKHFGWGIERVKKHQDWNGKYCPHRILAENRLDSFLKRIENAMKNQKELIEKDDDTMKFTNETLKAAVRDYLKQTVDKKLIDKSHLEKFDAGTLTDGDFKGLEIIIAQRSN